MLADLVFGWEYYGPDWVMGARRAAAQRDRAERRVGGPRLLRKSARNLLRRMRETPGGLAGLAKRQPAAESSANNTSRLGVAVR